MFNLGYRQLHEWEKRGIHLGGRSSGSWREFSIGDAIIFAVVKTLQDMGIPLSKSRSSIQNLMKSKVVKEAVIHFLNDDKVSLYVNTDQGACKLITPDNVTDLAEENLMSDSPFITIPLNLPLSYVIDETSGEGISRAVYRKLPADKAE